MARTKSIAAKGLALLILAVPLLSVPASSATAKGVGITPARGVELAGSPHRYTTLNPGLDTRVPTIVLRVEREGGRVDRWWRLRGRWFLPATAYDLNGSGISADGRTLVLQRFTMAYPPRRTRFAVLDTAVHLRHPVRPGEDRPAHAVRRLSVPGFYSLHSVSPDGTIAYLNRHLPQKRTIAKFELRALDLESGNFLSEPALETQEGIPITQLVSPDRRWVYTLYDGSSGYEDNGAVPFLLALDTVEGHLRRVELPQLDEPRTLFLTKLRFAAGGRKLAVFRQSPAQGRPPTPPLLAIDARSLAVSDIGTAMAALGRHLMVALAAALPDGEEPFLAFARTPRRPGNLLSRYEVVGRSSEGEPIGLKQMGDPRWSGELLVFDSEVEPLTGGCPDASADIFVVPDLHSEMRMARRISRAVDPQATIWFRRHRGTRPYVRAGGRSAAAARRFAHLARMPYRQIGAHPLTISDRRSEGASVAAFVVELPGGTLEPAMESRLSKALVRMGRWVRED